MAVPPGARVCGRACRHDGVAGRGRAVCCGQDGDTSSGANRANAVGVQVDRTTRCIFMSPGDSAAYSPVAPTSAPLGATCDTVGPVRSPRGRQSRRIPTAISSDTNRREYLKRNHMEYDFTKPQSNANTCMWSQSKTTNIWWKLFKGLCCRRTT